MMDSRDSNSRLAAMEARCQILRERAHTAEAEVKVLNRELAFQKDNSHWATDQMAGAFRMCESLCAKLDEKLTEPSGKNDK
jgi:hypothetical protein